MHCCKWLLITELLASKLGIQSEVRLLRSQSFSWDFESMDFSTSSVDHTQYLRRIESKLFDINNPDSLEDDVTNAAGYIITLYFALQ